MVKKKAPPLTLQAKDTYDAADYVTVHLKFFDGMREAIRHAHEQRLGNQCLCIYCGHDKPTPVETLPATAPNNHPMTCSCSRCMLG